MVPDSNSEKTMFNFYIDDKDMNTFKSNLYAGNLKDLADKTVMKVEDKSENDRISNFFSMITFVSMLQSGTNKSKYNFLNLTDFEKFITVMNDETSKFLESPSKIEMLIDFKNRFEIVNSNQNFDRYFVYVDSNNYEILQRVRQIEPNAYIRNYKGRNVIQSGVFNGQSNAQKRVRELEFNGISGAKIVNSENIELTPNYSVQPVMSYNAPGYNDQNYANNYQQEKRNSYYVVIPGNANNLRSLGTEIRQKVSININVFRRTQPLGTHIAVGPFSDRLEAEQWNSYLKSSGYGNARVYYGK
jgi:hypothetical protein